MTQDIGTDIRSEQPDSFRFGQEKMTDRDTSIPVIFAY